MSKIRSASDEAQVREYSKKEDVRRKEEIEDLLKVLDMPQGRRFIWRILEHTKTFGSIWENSARIHYLAGKQDVGHFIMSEVVEAREDALLEMMKESANRKRVKGE